jgi:LytS/YehU family sensor histidine kinase
MQALDLILRLLEKASVLVSVVLVLLMIRPAQVWLQETGREASPRRRIFLAVILSVVAIWGIFLGMSISGQRFNVRMLGIMVAGFLGGRKVGSFVGLVAGLVYGWQVGFPNGLYPAAASVLVGALAGWWSRKFGTGVRSIIVGATLVQLLYHFGIGSVMMVVDPELAMLEASNTTLHFAKILVNVVGTVAFLGVLNVAGELESLREEARVSQEQVHTARLEALQYQIQPHFLFNILNTLAYLIRTNPARARELTLDLSDFLRYTLARDREVTTLNDELGQIRRYVELERARFGDGLVFTTTGAVDAVKRVRVPPLILQPLVENAIRHASQNDRVNVEVRLTEQEGGLLVQVLDDGPGIQPRKTEETRASGLGLRNVRERLARFYEGSPELTLENRPEGGAIASFTIPLEPAGSIGRLARQAREKIGARLLS